MSDYEGKPMSELYAAWITNWKILQTGLQEIIGDEPIPDAREVARLMLEMPEDVWTGLFESEIASADLVKTMDLQALMAQVSEENVEILEAALIANGRL